MKSTKFGEDLQTLSLRPAPQATTIPLSGSHQVPSAASKTYKRCLAVSGLPDPSTLSDDQEIILPPLKVGDNYSVRLVQFIVSPVSVPLTLGTFDTQIKFLSFLLVILKITPDSQSNDKKCYHQWINKINSPQALI